MDRETFTDVLFGSYEDKVPIAVIDKAILKAQVECGVLISAVTETDEELLWLHNRVEYYAIFELCRDSARDYSYGEAKLGQVHKSYLALLKTLKERWEEEYKTKAEALKRSSDTNKKVTFGVVGSGYKYHRFGNPA